MRRYLKIFAILLVVISSALFYWWLNLSYYPPILMYHSVDPSKTETPSLSLESFSYQLNFLKTHNYKVISLQELIDYIKRGHIPKKTVVITFDDGYKDNLKAVELLNKYKFPAVIFMIVGYTGKRDYLSAEDLNWIVSSGKVEIGAHTYSHAYLPKAENPQKEIVEAKRQLQKLLNREIKYFSYPIGGFNKNIKEMVKRAGYKCGLTTNRGYSKQIDIYALRRIKMKDSDKGISLWFKLSGFYDAFRKLKRPQ